MWSYYQYRQIGKHVREEYTNTTTQKDVEKEAQRIEEQPSASSLFDNDCRGTDNQSTEPRDGEQSTETHHNEATRMSKDTKRPSSDDKKEAHRKIEETKRSSSDQKNKSLQKNDVEKGSSKDDKKDDPFIVCTSGEDDPFDPRNWPLLGRCRNIAILSLLIFVQAWAGAAGSQANSVIAAEFHVSQVAENLSTAMYLFGIGSGALFVGPISETVGRNPTYLGGTFLYMLFVLGTAKASNFGGQVVCRYFVGLFASATMAINGGSVQDQFRPVKRSFVFPIIAWANVAAPMIAPIAGGWIVADREISWRWTEWITLIISAFAFVIAFLFLPETHLPTLLSWKAAHLRKITGDDRWTPAHSEDSFAEQLRSVITLPVRFFALEVVIAVFGAYLILIYVLRFTFLSGFDYIFKATYKLPVEKVGSCFGAIAAGSTVFTLLAPGFYGLARRKTEHVRGRALSPEFRLWPAIIAGPLLAISLFWLGWTNHPSISIWSGLWACFIFGGCLTAIYVSIYEYVIDSYGKYSSIALASITMVRYFVAGGMVMAARPMFINIGVQWSLTWLGIVATILAPAPFAFWWWGGKMRNRSDYAKGENER